jgi:hypothetical protein
MKRTAWCWGKRLGAGKVNRMMFKFPIFVPFLIQIQKIDGDKFISQTIFVFILLPSFLHS